MEKEECEGGRKEWGTGFFKYGTLNTFIYLSQNTNKILRKEFLKRQNPTWTNNIGK